jgi:hydrogenase nickel incorporation protein HypA/HybF
MREYDIVQSAFEQVTRQSRNDRFVPIRAVKFARGELFELSQADIVSMWKKFNKGFVLEQAEIIFRLIPGEVQCMACFEKYHPEGGRIHCPHCGSFGAKILAGEEFYLESIE